MAIQTVTDAIRYVGVDDNTLALFENQYSVQPMGVSYNSSAIVRGLFPSFARRKIRFTTSDATGSTTSLLVFIETPPVNSVLSNHIT